MTKEEKLKLVQVTAKQIKKDMGNGAIMTLDEKPQFDEEVISTGSLTLDVATGVGGLPKGRIVEIYGDFSSGKTTIATHVVAECQKKGGIAGYIDVEHAFDTKYAQKLGVLTDELWFVQPEHAEEGLEIADRMINSGGLDVLVIDSVAALVPKGELEGEMGEAKMGLQARLMGQALRKMTHAIAKHNVLVIFINQTRDKIGVMYGSPETTSGGNALKFYASIRLRVSRQIDKDKQFSKVTVKVLKNKVAPPFKEASFDIVFGEGIDKSGEVLDFAVEQGLIAKGGAWFTLSDGTKVQGEAGMKQLFKDNEEYYQEIENKVTENLKHE